MWEDYFAEYLGAETYKTDWGFICFREFPESLHIEHMYVKPENRKADSHELLGRLKQIARTKEKKRITASTDQAAPGWQQSLKGQLNAEFNISAVSGQVIYTYLELAQGNNTEKQQGES